MFAGLAGAVCIFNLSEPGTNTHTTLTTCAKGIVSAMAQGYMPLPGDDALTEVLAVGTYAGSVSIYITEPSAVEAAVDTQPQLLSSTSRYGSERNLQGDDLCVAEFRAEGGQGVIQVRETRAAL